MRLAIIAILLLTQIAVSTPAPGGATLASAQNPPTYAKDIAPLFNANCVSCHRAGGIAPMPLTTHEEIRPWARSIREAMLLRKMPPWHADAPKGMFMHDPRLAEGDIAKIAAWIDAGVPKGADADLPPLPPAAPEWPLGAPDMILQPNEDFVVSAEGDDEYRCFVIANPLPEDRYVRATAIRPGETSVVHHAIIWIDGGASAAARDAADAKPGYSCFGGPGFQPVGNLGLWGPGYEPAEFTADVAYFLPARSSLVMQVHYHKSGKPAKDRTRIGLYFAEGVKNRVREVAIVNPRFEIPAGASGYEVRAQYVLPQNMTLISILPHMHLLGKSMIVTATLPNGSTQQLIRIPAWDFNWQRAYTYADTVTLPAGSRIDVSGVFDNSAANPRNPNNPPRPVRFGEATTDEMCVAYLIYVTR